MNKFCSFTICLYALVLFTTSAQAQGFTRIWLGAVNDNWDQSGNWSFNTKPGPNDDVIIPDGVAHMPQLNTTENIKSLTINEGAQLTILRNGALDIAGARGPGVVVGGVLWNQGKLSINNTLEAGLLIPKTGEALLQGETLIGQAAAIGGHGIIAAGHLIMRGELGQNSNPVAFLSIDNTSGNGINCDECIFELSEVISGDEATSNILVIGADNSTSIGGIGIRNTGSIDVQTGNIQIEYTRSDGIRNGIGLPSAAVLRLRRNATVNLENIGTANGSGLVNNEGSEVLSDGVILVNKSSQNGILNFSEFLNRADGNLLLKRSSGSALLNISGSFENTGRLDISGSNPAPLMGVQNMAGLINGPGAMIIIDQAVDRGIFNQEQGFIENEGQIEIGGTRKIGGAGIWNDGFVSNTSSGQLLVNHTGSGGVINFGEFRNEGDLEIGKLSAAGQGGIENGGIFHNLSDGTIDVAQARVSGIHILNEQFVNQGVITIGDNGSVGWSAISLDPGGTFSNQSCQAEIRIFDGAILDFADAFTNSGLIIQQSDTISYVGTNNGVIIFDPAGEVQVGTGNHPGSLESSKLGPGLWLGCASDEWDKAVNWYDNTLPTADMAIRIAGTGYPATVPIDSSISCTSLSIESKALLDIAGNLLLSGGPLQIKEDGILQGTTGAYEIAGSLLNAGIFDAPGATLLLNGSGNDSISGNPIDVQDFELHKPDGRTLLKANLSVENSFTLSSGDFEITPGGSLGADGISLEDGTTLVNNDSLFVEFGGKLSIKSGASLSGDGLYNLGGLWDNDGSFEAGSSEVRFIGPSALLNVAGSAYTSFHDLVLNKNSGELFTSADFTVLNRTILKDGELRVMNGQTIRLKDLRIEPDGRIKGEGRIEIAGNWINDGGFPSNQGSRVVFLGDAQSVIGGSQKTSFFNLSVNKTDSLLLLEQEMAVKNELNLSEGILDMNGFNIDLPGNGTLLNESAESYITDRQASATISKTLDLGRPNTVNPGNLGVTLSSFTEMGMTTVSRGHAIDSVNGQASINRYYSFQPSNNSVIYANLQFKYLDHELNGIAENELTPYQEGAAGWTELFRYAQSSFDNFIEFSGLDSITRITLAPPPLVSSLASPISEEALNLYPNPTSQQATIQLPERVGRAFLAVSDLSGRRISYTPVDLAQEWLTLDVQDWQAGVYVVQLQLEDKRYVHKLIVTKD